ncbi:tubulin folding cofactor D C terminal-domain-containing protein [Microdochium trichocladiopsis]|uniref:Tubulin folding cofactor D C terminal-domain-containing protein n=1 Tax=Microdochium trichocladiopsis TaxID=1682393 RepID=A0A9P9BQS9_9PEZI|nr:tubulin folding cofactor D C terminal-domain-containing protein [Microdochium trichocladiopsis]KAH7031218.1 tubulin folding cofactor D C terminal-domain-containing protein [Microdochium trichocladiopsis]
MDISELDQDVIVQQSSAGLIADFDRSLGPFLRKPNGHLRTRVRVREVARLTSQILEPFQELPQLLDSHLPRWLPALSEAYLACLSTRQRSRSLSARSQWLTPLPDAICKVLYTFCKIRGDKVIVRFLNVETRYLELLLHSLEQAERQTAVPAQDGESQPPNGAQWSWHERYIVLLWLSQLFFAPFDLSTISTGDADDVEQPTISGFAWPDSVPGITLRVIPLAIQFLSCPGKERDGAKALLVRLAMRRDMQEARILNALIHWSLHTLKTASDPTSRSPYYYIGSLSFIAGVLRSSMDTSIMDSHLSEIFYAIEAIASSDDEISTFIKGSALARKMMIKVIRSTATLVLRKQDQSMSESELIETSIGFLLERLADNDTPVRLAASKALSVITLKLEADMASQVVSAVLESLNRNVLWLPSKINSATAPPNRDLTAVDPLEWHGLMLTLAHLLYRRSPPTEDLSDIVHALLMGLTFEKRSPSGSLIGSNVRDAACFGIWALARRYSTAELLQVPKHSVQIARGHDASVSILQVIATELVVTASLDPAGNIRRGSSAALQELIGRHPDTVDHGIAVVQTVDYHAVALRSRAINAVALQATQLSLHYGRALLNATLGWRGIGDLDADARRVAAQSFGNLTAELARADPTATVLTFQSSIELLISHLKSLQTRQVEERHGLLLSLAAVIDALLVILKQEAQNSTNGIISLPFVDLPEALISIWSNSATVKYRKPELIAEAASQLFVSAAPLLVLLGKSPDQLNSYLKSDRLKASEVAREATASTLHDMTLKLEFAVDTWLEKDGDDVTIPASTAALWLLAVSSSERRPHITSTWCDVISRPLSGQNFYHNGHFRALVRAYEIQSVGIDVCQVLTNRWKIEPSVELRVAILQSLLERQILQENPDAFLTLIAEGLDDYHTNARGDVGSHVRLEAIKATKTVWATRQVSQEFMSAIFPRILKLAAEKLDRVRLEAQAALAMVLPESSASAIRHMSFASKEYFTLLFSLCDTTQLDQQICGEWHAEPADMIASLLAGLVTSADTGNEDLVVVSRAALAFFCEESPSGSKSNGSNPAGGHNDDDVSRLRSNLTLVADALINNLRRYILENQDRVVLPTLEVIAYLFHIGIFPGFDQHQPQKSQQQLGGPGQAAAVATEDPINLKRLCLLVQKAGYKTGSVRKLEACIRVYGEIARLGASNGGKDDAASPVMAVQLQKRCEGIAEAKKRLAALLVHPWPRVRSAVVDELWVMFLCEGPQQQEQGQKQQYLAGIDWSKADRAKIRNLVENLGLEQPMQQQPQTLPV